mmetsp:Transcript_12989/g.42832  ORF Transcript_12989/g.42832 Transcript_12989/m.42832 type:complete len:231 (+) Transcript_12989:31-723(+)
MSEAVVFSFGKFRGQACRDVWQEHPDYVEWLVDKDVLAASAYAAEREFFVRAGVLEKLSDDESEGADGEYRLTFGRWRGTKISRVPSSYFQWLRRNDLLSNHPELEQALTDLRSPGKARGQSRREQPPKRPATAAPVSPSNSRPKKRARGAPASVEVVEVEDEDDFEVEQELGFEDILEKRKMEAKARGDFVDLADGGPGAAKATPPKATPPSKRKPKVTQSPEEVIVLD